MTATFHSPLFRRLLCILILLFSLFTRNSGMSSCLAANREVMPGALRIQEYLPLLAGKQVAVTGNHTSMVGRRHLVDTLLSLEVNIVRIFGPEHGFRGDHADGADVNSSVDSVTGIPVVSLYGNHRKPTPEDLNGVELMLFDIQDAGCRFYTYISTLTYMMEACAEKGIPLIVLDRPNPNGYYIDGPVLEEEYASFVGLHPVPVVYGMTIGEYAQMINGEGWLKDHINCDLRVIKCRNYTHRTRYRLPVAPSPNLPNMKAVYLYPSLCLFEGTVVSVGRGTEKPFQVIGHPDCKSGSYSFTPRKIPGVSDNPPLLGQECHGYSLQNFSGRIMKHGRLELSWLTDMYQELNLGDSFFTNYFEKLAGTGQLRNQIMQGCSKDDIRDSWQPGIEQFKLIRGKYLLYPDF